MRTYLSTSEAYLSVLKDVHESPDFLSAPRGQQCREKLDYSFRVSNPSDESIITMDEERNKVIASYTEKEKDLYNSCSNRVEDFAKASKFWNHIANSDGTINSAYGYLIWEKRSHGSFFEQESVSQDGSITAAKMRTPWEWCVESLRKDKDTRQAVLRFSLPEHQWMGNKDQTCTMHANWLIREDKLHLSVVMRSNDLVKGLVYDMPWFCSLMDKMVNELKDIYPNLTKGNYTHTVHSIHLYDRDLEVIKKMIGK